MVPTQPTSRPASRVIAIAGSVAVGLLFVAAAIGLGANSMFKLRMLRLTPATLGVALLPVPAVAWLMVLWSRPVSAKRDALVRLVVTLLLIVAAVVCATLTLLILFLQPVPRGEVP